MTNSDLIKLKDLLLEFQFMIDANYAHAIARVDSNDIAVKYYDKSQEDKEKIEFVIRYVNSHIHPLGL
jgi:BioD-like phosphotransacetylase family protein